MIFRATVTFNKENCVLCGTCWQNCPTEAISPPAQMRKGIVPTWHKPQCITCYCCAETCPQDAVDFRIKILKNLFASWVGPGFVAFLVLLIWAFTQVL